LLAQAIGVPMILAACAVVHEDNQVARLVTVMVGSNSNMADNA